MEIFFTLDLTTSKHPYKYQTIYHFIKNLILDGKVEVGMRLPSTRELAERYHVNRNTIKQVYEMLIADGYVSTVEGSGTYVEYSPQRLRLMEKSSNKSFQLSKWGQRIPSKTESNKIQTILNFNGAGFSPDISHFPVEEWKKTIYQATRELNFLVNIDDYEVKGLYSLREAISVYLHRTRGMAVNPSHIVIINGVMQGIGILSQLLIDPGDSVVVEEPSFQSIKANFITAGANLILAPVEPNGFKSCDWQSRLIYVTPSHQFPTGSVMKLDERLKLLQWAKERNAIIIEDDYDSEFQRKGRPIEPLKVLDYDDRVVYLGTFAKNILPSLRIGYAILPPDLINDFLKARNLYGEYTTSIIEQMAAALFIKTGRLERHLRKLKRTYSHKYDIFKREVAKHKFDAFEWVDTNAGLHLFGTWKYTLEEYLLFEKECADKGLSWQNAESYYNISPLQPKVIFGFSHLSGDKILFGIETMSEVFELIKTRQEQKRKAPVQRRMDWSSPD